MSVKIAKVLISDNVDQKCEDLLTANGVQVVRKCNLKPDELIKELEVNFEVFICSDLVISLRISYFNFIAFSRTVTD